MNFLRKIKYKQYWILKDSGNWNILLINGYCKWQRTEFHIISIFRKWSGDSYDYYFSLLGFQLRIIDFRKLNSK